MRALEIDFRQVWWKLYRSTFSSWSYLSLSVVLSVFESDRICEFIKLTAVGWCMVVSTYLWAVTKRQILLHTSRSWISKQSSKFFLVPIILSSWNVTKKYGPRDLLGLMPKYIYIILFCYFSPQYVLVQNATTLFYPFSLLLIFFLKGGEKHKNQNKIPDQAIIWPCWVIILVVTFFRYFLKMRIIGKAGFATKLLKGMLQ